jgi:hypothetical protein
MAHDTQQVTMWFMLTPRRANKRCDCLDKKNLFNTAERCVGSHCRRENVELLDSSELYAGGAVGRSGSTSSLKIGRPQRKSMYLSGAARLVLACRPGGSPNPAPRVRARQPVQPQQALWHAERHYG